MNALTTHRLSFLPALVLVVAGCSTTPDGKVAVEASSAGATPVESTPVERTAPVTEVAAAEAPQATGLASIREGRIIEGEVNIRTFRPEETATGATDASSISIREVFEGLGEDAALWYQHVQALASPFFEGRSPGTRGMAYAVDYLEFCFRQAGLEPAFGESAASEPTSYRQPFDFASPRPKIVLHDTALSLGDRDFEESTDYVALGCSASTEARGPVTFVGYGLASGPDEYSSFDEDTDLSGRIALVLRYEPLDEEGYSQWSPQRFSRRASLSPKLAAVAELGAAGILLINPPGAVDGAKTLETPESAARFARRRLDIPVLQITPETAEAILASADGESRSLETLQELADQGLVTTVDFDPAVEVALSADLDVDSRLETANIGGVLRGRGDLADEWIVVGAHYDHVGYGYTGTRPGNVGQLHPGADDNASGTAGLVILAGILAEHYGRNDEDSLRSILFLAFSAEEAGLHGSRYYVDHPTIPLDQTTLMVNMDMIGRLRSDTITLHGTGSAEEFDELLSDYVEPSGLTVMSSPGGSGPSDHTNFNAKEIPVLFPFTGVHDDYHQPTDFAHTVNPAGAMKVLDLVETIVLDIAARPEQLTWASTSSATQGRRTASRVRLGIMPAYGADLETGVMVEEVTEGTSAADGGIEPGDVLLSWNGEELDGGQKLFQLLRDANPGDIVDIEVQRGDEEIPLRVTLKARSTDS